MRTAATLFSWSLGLALVGGACDAGGPHAPSYGLGAADGSGGETAAQGALGGSGTGTGGVIDTSETGETDDSGSMAQSAYPDLSLGPYTSLLTIAIDSIVANAERLDTRASYGDSAGQGYVLQSIGELLWDARDHDLPERDLLIDTALGEIDELEAASDRVLGGGPAFGLDKPREALRDDSTNPAFTAYTWQSGMVALGVAKIVRVLEHEGHPAQAEVREFGEALVTRWDDCYTSVEDGGFWWYSTRSADEVAVHNTSALMAMASQILSETGSDASFGERPRASADLLWARMSGNLTTGYTWNYADDFSPSARRAEDVAHALVTLQLMREAGDRGWWSHTQMKGVGKTLTDNIWSGHPARLHGAVDGSSTDDEWTRSRAAVIGYAVHGDAPGGDPLVFELGRSLLFSGYLGRFERSFEGSTVDNARTLAIALLLAHRPEALAYGSHFEVEAGPGDDAIPTTPGGVRFYTVDWGAPTDLDRGLLLPARTSTAAKANVLVDLDEGDDGQVLVSLTYAAETTGTLQQYDGSEFHTLGSLPATVDDEGELRWMRTTVQLDADRFDYQQSVPGTNVLLQLTHAEVSVNRIEATPL